jgi:hypothetical protein
MSSNKIKDKEDRRSTKKDRRKFIDVMAIEADETARRREIKTVTMWPM